MSADLQAEITMSLVRALWGEITPEVRAVIGRVEGPRAFSIEFYVDGEAEKCVDAASCIEAEVLADFHEDFEISHSEVRLYSPNEIPIGNGFLVYLRKESVSD